MLAVTERFVYVAKPAGHAHPRLRPDEPGALADAVARHHPECAHASSVPREGGAIHRLDRETTGVVAFARSPRAWLEGRRALGHPEALKLYLALCHAPGDPRWPPAHPGVQPREPAALPLPPGIPCPAQVQTAIVSLPLGRGGSRREVAVRPGGHPAQSWVTPLARGPSHWLVALHLRQGHRHQARVHLAALGLPIDGDGRYGGGEGALALHAVVLDLSAACAGEPRVVCPLPAALAQRLDALSLRAWGA
ncbi:MAG: pseudouridine synthase [Nannocystaceae bacterium]